VLTSRPEGTELIDAEALQELRGLAEGAPHEAALVEAASELPDHTSQPQHLDHQPRYRPTLSAGGFS
jgi:hypothetical protein